MPNPKSFSRGKRGIAGSLVFTIFDRDALSQLKAASSVHRHFLNQTEAYDDGRVMENVHQQAATATNNYNNLANEWSQNRRASFIDEIPPFDITINFLNEYGQSAKMSILGVEILNEGMGMSIDDITTEKACTFIARNIVELQPDAYESN